VGGNEGLAVVTDVGDGVAGLSKHDWVVMNKSQAGTWSSRRNVGAADVLKLNNVQGVSEVQAATITVNPPTAYNMLHDFVALAPSDWVVQNGANSAVRYLTISFCLSL
jgi:mitochondrial enoyl-[acyl-carrier protein] reductase / trans-2-enoyl-CoA reductase